MPNRMKWELMLVIAAVLAVVAYFQFKPEPAPAGVHIEATPAKPIAKVEQERVECVPVVVYKTPAKKALKLPESVTADPETRVAASTTTANDERQHTITTALDTSTGEFQTFDRVEPRPWLAVSTKSEAGIYYGLKDGEQAVRFEARQEFLQIKALRAGIVASADMTPGDLDTFVGVGAWARW